MNTQHLPAPVLEQVNAYRKYGKGRMSRMRKEGEEKHLVLSVFFLVSKDADDVKAPNTR